MVPLKYVNIIFIYVCMYEAVCLFASCACRCPQRSEGFGSLGTGVIGVCEPPDVDVGP